MPEIFGEGCVTKDAGLALIIGFSKGSGYSVGAQAGGMVAERDVLLVHFSRSASIYQIGIWMYVHATTLQRNVSSVRLGEEPQGSGRTQEKIERAMRSPQQSFEQAKIRAM